MTETLCSQVRRPRETAQEFAARITAERTAFERLLAMPPSLDLACGVGTFDAGGRPKGSGWR